MSQRAADEWRMPFVHALPLIHRSLVRMFSIERHAELLGRDTAALTYDCYDAAARRRFFNERLLASYDDVIAGHRECEAAALQRLVVVAVSTTRFSVALVLNWRPRAGYVVDGSDGLKAPGLRESLAVALRHAAVAEKPLHVVGIVWNADKAPSQQTRARVAAELRKLDDTASLELFPSRELLYNPTEHSLQPATIGLYRPTSPRDAASIRDDYEKLRRVSADDPVWRRLGARPGAIVQYGRTDSRLGSARVLRVGALEEASADDRRAEFARIAQSLVST